MSGEEFLQVFILLIGYSGYPYVFEVGLYSDFALFLSISEDCAKRYRCAFVSKHVWHDFYSYSEWVAVLSPYVLVTLKDLGYHLADGDYAVNRFQHMENK